MLDWNRPLAMIKKMRILDISLALIREPELIIGGQGS